MENQHFSRMFREPAQSASPKTKNSQILTKTPIYRRLAQPRHTISNPVTPSTPLPVLRDLDQPFTYTIRLYNRPYTFEFYDTSSPEHWTRLAPDFVVICFDIDNRESLQHAKTVWKREVAISFGADREAKLPLMLLGLKRDLRCMKDSMIWPQEVRSSSFIGIVRCCSFVEGTGIKTNDKMHHSGPECCAGNAL